MRLLRLPVAPGVATVLAGASLVAVVSATPVRAHGIESRLEKLSVLNPDTFTAPAKPATAKPATAKPSTSKPTTSKPSTAKSSSAKRLPAKTPQADTLQLQSRFSSGEPAQSATVRLVPPQGEAIVLGQTNAEGQLRFQLPRQAGSDWELQVDAGPGHRDYLELNESLMDAGATLSVPAVNRSPLARKLAQPQRSHMLVGLTGAGLGMAGLLSVSRRRR
jgi:nickel transport protein